MKFSCETSLFTSAVSAALRAVTSKSSLATLEGILIRTNHDEIILSGYDLEIAIQTVIPASVEIEGCTVINAKILYDILRKLPEERVCIEIADNNKAYITSGSSEFSIIALDANEYPELPTLEEKNEISIPADILQSMISQTIFAVSTSDERPIYKGVLFQINGDEIKTVAMDGCRLAIRKENIADTGREFEFVVPAKALQEVLKMIGEEETSDVKIEVSRRHICFAKENYTMISRLIDGIFLDYTTPAIIPPEEQTVVIADTREMLSLIERISLIIVERLKSPVRCTYKDNEIFMRCSTIMGKASDFLSVDGEGDEQEIGFNGRFFTDALRAVDCDKVKIVFNGPQRPIKILPLEGDDFLFIVVPVIMKAEPK